MSARWRLAAVAALFALTAAACGNNSGGDKVASLGDGKNGNAQNTDNKTDEDKLREYTKCMRENGFDMPDPGSGSTEAREVNEADMEKMEKANKACQKLLPNGGKPKPLTPEELDKQRKIAKCMRDHGINMPDPDPNNPGMTITTDGNVDSGAMDKAMKECGMGEFGPAVGGGK